MNIKISKSLHEELCKLSFKEYLFGSQLHGVADIVTLYENNINCLPDVEFLKNKEKELRCKLNDMLNRGEIMSYPVFDEKDELANIINKSNNIKEFRYENNSNGGL